MDFGSMLEISASGLAAQKARLAVISNNIANATTTRTAEGGPYRRRSIVIEAAAAAGGGFSAALEKRLGVAGVAVSQVQSDNSRPRQVYEPAHPDADASGYVAYPNINTVEEMADMMTATRAYEANVTAAQATKSMAMKTLELGK